MGMTDKQFNLIMKLIKQDLLEVKEAESIELKNEKLDKMLANIQTTIED